MKKAFFEDSAMAMAKLIVESIYHGMEENEGVYADLMYSNGKGQHGWAHIFQNEHEHLTKAGYRVVLMVSGSWKSRKNVMHLTILQFDKSIAEIFLAKNHNGCFAVRIICHSILPASRDHQNHTLSCLC